MKHLVMLSLEPWDEVWRRNQHMIANLLKLDEELNVLFIEPAADPLHELRSYRVPRRRAGLRRVTDRLFAFQPTKWLPRRLDHRSDDRLTDDLVEVISKLGWSDPVLWINDPVGAILLRRTGWRALYDLTDDWAVANRSATELERTRAWEQTLLARCEEVVACSRRLVDVKGTHRKVHLVPNAVDVDAYLRPMQRPADLPHGRTALYLGTAHRDRFDVELCVRTARDLGENGTMVLVGPAPLPIQDLAALRTAGVEVLGPKRSADVPAYLSHADVLVVPHVLTAFTESLDPIKAYEYRAAGRPVVATAVPGFREVNDYRVTVTTPEQFPTVVTARVLEGSRKGVERETGPAEVPTWVQRAQQMAGILDGLWDP